MLSPDPVFSILLIALAVAGAGILVAFSLRYVTFGAGLVMVVFLWRAWSIEPLPAIYDLSGINVYPEDIVFSVIALVATARLLHLGMRVYLRPPYLVWFFFGVLIMIAFFRGVVAYGPGAAGVEFRKFFYFFSGGLYFGSFSPLAVRINNLGKCWLCAAILLLLLVLIRWAMELLGLPVAEDWSSRGSMRVLDAAEALFLAQALLICVYLRLGRGISPFLRSFAILLLPVLILLQHRTVWVALFVAFVAILWREGMLRKRLLMIISTGSVVMAVVMLLAFGDHGMEKLTDSATNLSTWEWRVSGWKALIGEHLRNPLDVLIGKPFGAGYARVIGPYNNLVEVSPHNFYVELLLRVGLVGLLCLMSLYLILLRQFGEYRPAAQSPLHFIPRLLYVIALTHLACFITYSPNHDQGILLGVMFGVAFALQRENQHLPKPEALRVNDRGGAWQH